MSEPGTRSADIRGSGSGKSRLLFVVARGQGALCAAIRHALRGVPEVEVIEDRREDEALLPRSKRPSGADTGSSAGRPESDARAVALHRQATPTLAFGYCPAVVLADSRLGR